jgi:hypothetical protein
MSSQTSSYQFISSSPPQRSSFSTIPSFSSSSQKRPNPSSDVEPRLSPHNRRLRATVKEPPQLKSTNNFWFTGAKPNFWRRVDVDHFDKMIVGCNIPNCDPVSLPPRSVIRTVDGSNNYWHHFARHHPELPRSKKEAELRKKNP